MIVHEIVNDEQGFIHRLIDTEENLVGWFTGYTQIAMLGKYRARMLEYWGDDMPEIYTEEPVNNKRTRTIARPEKYENADFST